MEKRKGGGKREGGGGGLREREDAIVCHSVCH